MASILIITSVNNLQNEIIKEVKAFSTCIGIYVSLNKTQKSTEHMLSEKNINSNNMFFIDCVTTEKSRDDVLHIAPDQLDLLSSAIQEFIKDIKQQKFLIIDALSTLLIYNDENKVAKFVKQVTEYASKNDIQILAFSPETKGEELLNKIFNFFDEVQKR